MVNTESKKIFINEEKIGQQNLLTITGKIEIEKSKKGNYFIKELIYVSFHYSYNSNEAETMQFKGVDMFNLIAALEEIYITGSSEFKKFTDSNKSKNSDENKKKFISLNQENDMIYINLNLSNSNEKFKPLMNISFKKYEVKGVIKTLECFMNEYKQAFYKAQRSYEKINRERKED